MREELVVSETAQCPLVQDLLPLYLDNEVTHESHMIIANHLAACERCNGFLAGARTMNDLLRREQQVRSDIIAGDQDQQTILAGKRLMITAIVIITAIVAIALTVLMSILSPMFFNPPGM